MPPAGSISIPTKLLATGVACALAIVVCGTAATVVVASDVTTRVNRGSRIGSFAASDALSGRVSFRDTGATAEAIDSLLAPLGPTVMLDPNFGALLNAFNTDQAPDSIWATPPAAMRLPAPVPSQAYSRTPTRLALEGLTPGEFELASRATNDPWLAVFRAWARGPRQAALWGYREGLPGSVDARALPMRAFGPWRAMFAENEYAMRLALRSGDTDEAMQRALENISASRNFIEQPVMIDALVGRMYMQRGLQLVSLIARQRGDTATAHRALRLDSATRSFVNAANMRALVQQSADPGSSAALSFMADRDNHPALRVDAMRTITMGGCRRLPEIVFGFSRARRNALERAAQGLADIDRSQELVTREQKLFDHIASASIAPDSLPKNSVLERSMFLNAFSWIVPPGVRARAGICLQQNLRNETSTVRENAVVGVH